MLTEKTIMDYFEDNIDYPNDVALNPLPMNTLYCYISSTFLNGFINYVDPLKIYVLNRYADDKTQDVINLKSQSHTKMRQFNDDIILLAKIDSEENELNIFMFFWFDMDVSDCCIGKFQTTDSKEIVCKSLTNWLEKQKLENKGRVFCEDHDNGILGFHELPKSFIEGWVSF